MPSKKKASKMKRKKLAQKQQNVPQLQFVGENEDHSDVGTSTYSRHSEDEAELDENDVIENSQPTVVKRIFQRNTESLMDKKLKEAGMYEEGMSESQKEDILNVINESLQMTGDIEENFSDASADLFSNNGPFASKKHMEKTIEKQEISAVNVSDDDFMIPATVQSKAKKPKLRNIFTTVLKKMNETLVSDPEKNCEQSVPLENKEKTIAESDAIVPDGNKTLDIKHRPILLRPNLSAQKHKSRERESPVLNHISLFAPSDVAPRSYTQVIKGYFDNYLESLSQVEQLTPRLLLWDNPVVVGRHNKNTIDVIKPGHRVKDLRAWYEICMNGNLSDSDSCEIDAKKPRLDDERESPMMVDDENSNKEDDEDGENEDEDNTLKSYLSFEEPEFEFNPEKSLKSYSRAKSGSEKSNYIKVPRADSVEVDILDSLEAREKSPSKKTRSNQKTSEGNENDDESSNVNQSNQSLVKKFMPSTRKENNTSLFSAFIAKAIPWKTRISKQDEKNIQSKNEINCVVCQQAFREDEIDDHTAKCGSKDAEEANKTESPSNWCHQCQRVIAGVQVECGRHTKNNRNNSEQKK